MKRLSLALSLLVSTILLTGCFPAIVAGTTTTVSLVHDRRTVGTVVDDKGIQLKAGSEIRQAGLTKNNHIVVVSYNNNVLLAGQIDSEANAVRATDIVQTITNVQDVYNELEVMNPTSLARRTRDSWVTTKVKTRLLRAKNLDPTRVKVITENSIVFLMGLVSPEEATIATEATRKASGVTHIVRLFNYIEESG